MISVLPIPERNSYVGFTVYSSEQYYVEMNDIVKYDTVITDEGGNYDPSTGYFTCPVTGLYYFSASSGSHDGHVCVCLEVYEYILTLICVQ